MSPRAKGKGKETKKREDAEKQEKITQEEGEELTIQVEEAEAEGSEQLSELEQLNNKLAEKDKEAAENYEKMLRAQADLDNYKKRILREKADLFNYRHEDLIKELLPIIDNLERAIDNAGKSSDCSALVEGVELIYKQFVNCLDKFGVKSVSSLGEKFDPALHEAISQAESSEHAPNTVMEEAQKGYLLKDRLLRPSLVVVSRQPEDTKAAEGIDIEIEEEIQEED
ncbi:MAG: nucleotide exchange factor GrpE [Deltaproteobacteria bacterium]|nr:MAG: nucleotide exchange factor GrpE [Deltaproteobacteria bacterium]